MDSVISWAIFTILGIIGVGWFVWRIDSELSEKYGKDDDDYWK